VMSAEAQLEDQLPTVPAQSAREAGVLPPVEGEDPPLDFEWDEQEEAVDEAPEGSTEDLLAQAQEAEMSGQIDVALRVLEAAAAADGQNPEVQDAVASFLVRNPNI